MYSVCLPLVCIQSHMLRISWSHQPRRNEEKKKQLEPNDLEGNRYLTDQMHNYFLCVYISNAIVIIFAGIIFSFSLSFSTLNCARLKIESQQKPTSVNSLDLWPTTEFMLINCHILSDISFPVSSLLFECILSNVKSRWKFKNMRVVS